ncbi:hypothetical protein VTH82DRAFT_514 [Thermothelomyces myriococcoides]
MSRPTPSYYGREPDNQPIKPSAVRYLSEFAVSDTPETSGSEFTEGDDYLQARFAPTHPLRHQQQCSHQQPPPEGGMPSALGRGVPGGSGPVDEAERRETHYISSGSDSGDSEERDNNNNNNNNTEGGGPRRRRRRRRRQNENVDAGEGQMEMYAEGKVAEAVRRKAGTQVPSSWKSTSGPPGVEGGNRRKNMVGLHGRGRGEVRLEVGEADLER